MPAQLKGRKFAFPRAEPAQDYLVLFGLVSPTIDLAVFGCLETAAVRGQGQLGLALAASEALRVVGLARRRLHLLQRVDWLAAPEAGGAGVGRLLVACDVAVVGVATPPPHGARRLPVGVLQIANAGRGGPGFQLQHRRAGHRGVVQIVGEELLLMPLQNLPGREEGIRGRADGR